MDYGTVRNIASSGEGYNSRVVLDQEVYAAGFSLGNTDWYMASVMPSSYVLMHKALCSSDILRWSTLSLWSSLF